MFTEDLILILLLFLSFVFSLLGSISLPFIPALDIVHVTFNIHNGGSTVPGAIRKLQIGVWGFCSESASSGVRTCTSAGLGYTLDLQSSVAVHISSTMTGGLVMHPIATSATFVAMVVLILAAIFKVKHILYDICISLPLWFATATTLGTLLVDIAVTVSIRKKLNDLGLNTSSKIGFGFGTTIMSLLLLLSLWSFIFFAKKQQKWRKPSIEEVNVKTSYISPSSDHTYVTSS